MAWLMIPSAMAGDFPLAINLGCSVAYRFAFLGSGDTDSTQSALFCFSFVSGVLSRYPEAQKGVYLLFAGLAQQPSIWVCCRTGIVATLIVCSRAGT